MKQLISLMLTGLFLLGCKKNDNNTTPTPNPTVTKGWKLGSTNYTQVVAVRSSKYVSAFDAMPSGSSPATNSFVAYFATLPTADGTYTVVSYPNLLTGNQVGIVGGLYATSSSYASTGTDATPVQVTVTVTNGKIKIVVPEIWVKKAGSSTDSLKMSGTMVED